MQNYVVELSSEVSDSFMAQKAANSVDLDVGKKSKHYLAVSADLESEYNIGLIIGASGSGKTTLAKKIFGENCFKNLLDLNKSIIDQFPNEISYNDRQAILNGVGLSSIPCWIKPSYTLSNGQRSRAEMALHMASKNNFTVIDEFTSVVDRTVAKVMANCIAKYSRKINNKIVLCSCHYDVTEWLNPDWIIDCNKQLFIDRRLLQKCERERTEKLNFKIKEINKSSWKYYSKFHYLSERIPGGKSYFFGLFTDNGEQIGFSAYTNYVPTRKGLVPIFHSNRVVIHPDYCGIGLSKMLCNETAKIMIKKGVRVMAKFSSLPMAKWRMKDNNWRLLKIERNLKRGKVPKGKPAVLGNSRIKVKTYTFEFSRGDNL